MARMAPERSTRIEPSPCVYSQPLNRRMALPFKDHPIFHLRKALIIIAVIGILLCCLASSNRYYYGERFGASALSLGLSALLCISDLIPTPRKGLNIQTNAHNGLKKDG